MPTLILVAMLLAGLACTLGGAYAVATVERDDTFTLTRGYTSIVFGLGLTLAAGVAIFLTA